MAATFLFTRRRWDESPQSTAGESAAAVSMAATVRHPLVQIQIVVFFLYTGLEVMLGQWSFTLLTESRLVRTDLAGILVGVYFGAIGVGRVLLGAMVERIGVDRLVRFSTLTALLGTLLLAFGSPVEVGMLGLAITGWGLAAIFPCLMSRTPQRVGDGYATHAIGFQVAAAMIGVAIVPGVAGLIAQRAGLESIALLAVVLASLLVGMHELLLARSVVGFSK
jgi:fucose permease